MTPFMYTVQDLASGGSGDTGAAAMKSIIQHIDRAGSRHRLVLYNGVSTGAGLYEHA